MAMKVADVLGGRVIPSTGGAVEKVVSIACDNAYATGGYALTPAQCGLSTISQISDAIQGGKIVHYDPATAKVLVYVCGASGAVLSEAANASDQSGITDARVRVVGT